MSTKTSIKRIALVAVAGLGLGMVTTVAANAAIGNYTVTSSVTNSTNTGATSAPIPAGTNLTADLTLQTAGALAAADSRKFIFTITAGPASKDITATCTFTAGTAPANSTITVSNAATGEFTVLASGAADFNTAAVTIGTVSCPTTIGGAYVITPTETAVAGTWGTATDTAVTKYVSGGNVSQGLTRSTTAGTASVGGAATVLFTIPTHGTSATAYNVVSSGVGSISSVSAADSASGSPTVARVNGSAADYSAGAVVTTAASNALVTATVNLTSAVAGVQTLTLSSTNSTTGVVTTVSSVTVTWGSVAGVSAAFTAAGSFIGNGTTRPTANATTGLYYPKANAALANTTGATIAVNVFDTNNVAMNGVSLSVTIEGPGLITLASGTGTGSTGTVRSASLTAANQAATHQAVIGVSGDGTAGKSTITVSTGTTVLFTKSVVFYGTVAKLTATQKLSIAKASTTSGGTLGSAVAAPAGTTVATTPAVIIVATDANGNVVPGLAITAKSADTSLIASGSVIESDGNGAGDGYAGPGSYNASVTSAVGAASGASTTVVFRTLLADGVTYVSADPVTFTLGGSAYYGTVSAAFDQASYATGDAATLTVSVKDSKGNPIYDQDLNLWGGLGTAPIFSKSVNGSTPSGAATTTFVGGKHVYNMYAPAVDGAFSVKGTLDSLTVASGAEVSASATVADVSSSAVDAANEATDAANAATDAANAAAEAADAATAAAQDAQAAVAALATQVSSLIAGIKAQITSLTNLVIKIQKKVRA